MPVPYTTNAKKRFYSSAQRTGGSRGEAGEPTTTGGDQSHVQHHQVPVPGQLKRALGRNPTASGSGRGYYFSFFDVFGVVETKQFL